MDDSQQALNDAKATTNPVTQAAKLRAAIAWHEDTIQALKKSVFLYRDGVQKINTRLKFDFYKTVEETDVDLVLLLDKIEPLAVGAFEAIAAALETNFASYMAVWRTMIIAEINAKLFSSQADLPTWNGYSNAAILQIRWLSGILEDYGVTLTQRDNLSNFERGEIDVDQLDIVIQGVEQVGELLAEYVADITNEVVTPEQAFIQVLSPIEIGYNILEGENYSKTYQTGDRMSPIVITFVESAFELVDFPAAFVVVHELGHAFHFRNDTSRESDIIQEYSDAVDAYWRRVSDECFSEMTTISVNDRNYTTVPDPEDPQRFCFFQGTYYLGNGNYGTYSPLTPDDFYPNEYCDNDKRQSGNCHPNAHPMEGFADTFANFVLRPSEFPSDEVRSEHFANKFATWVTEILNARNL